MWISKNIEKKIWYFMYRGTVLPEIYAFFEKNYVI